MKTSYLFGTYGLRKRSVIATYVSDSVEERYLFMSMPKRPNTSGRTQNIAGPLLVLGTQEVT